jgi:uncharacterized protein YraI
MRKYLVSAASASVAVVVALTGTAFGQSSATASADLNIRSGPGPNHAVTGFIPADGAVTVAGCIEGSMWCRVIYDGSEGWAYAEYLTVEHEGSRVVIAERRAEVGVPVVQREAVSAGGAAGSTVGAAGGAIAGALIGGPVGAAIGGVAGAAAGGVTGSVIDPPSEVRTYVREQRIDTVYLEGEVVVGAGIPENVELRPVPDYEYHYVYINEVPVLVEPDTRRIVYVIR